MSATLTAVPAAVIFQGSKPPSGEVAAKYSSPLDSNVLRSGENPSRPLAPPGFMSATSATLPSALTLWNSSPSAVVVAVKFTVKDEESIVESIVGRGDNDPVFENRRADTWAMVPSALTFQSSLKVLVGFRGVK
jgi:hypothetical protein